MEPTSGLELIPTTSRIIAHAELNGSAACGFESLAAIRLGRPQDADTGAAKRCGYCGQFPVSQRGALQIVPDTSQPRVGLSRADLLL